ncbi:hypothetical protein [Psychrobacter aestuarii]|uniref:Lipoprotein n=1 Tax=Psychrobacter aestuarii TaxID=556327 RepID=A0ABP3F911_9GAMM|nr:hypothetical protein [Psychrobacter aestuarii]
MRKHLLYPLTLLSALAIAGCAAPNGTTPTGNTTPTGTAADIGMTIFKTAVDNQCRATLQNQQLWQIASVGMTPQQEEVLQSRICGCVSEQAPKQVTLVDMANAAIDPQYRNQLVTKVVANTIQTCYSSLVR